MKSNQLFINLTTAFLIILFTYTGFNKLLDFDTFKLQLEKSPYVHPIANIISISLPIGEILVVILLILPKTRLLGLYTSYSLMLFFSGYIWIMLHYSYYLPCSCGGILSSMSWKDHLIFNGLFTLLSLIAIILESHIKYKHIKTDSTKV